MVAFAHVLSAKLRNVAEGPHSRTPFAEGTVASAQALRKGSRKDLIPHSNLHKGLCPHLPDL